MRRQELLMQKILQQMFKKELEIFLTAVMFYTRIPTPRWVNYSPEYLNKASRYFPLMGWIVASVAFGFIAIGSSLFGADLAIALSMMATILITGAFHEDGFADMCDGFGGGYTKERILEIMKDSRVGAYGVVGLIMILLIKFLTLRVLVDLSHGFESQLLLLLILIAAHSLSRFSAISILFTHQYVQADAVSKIKPIALSYTWKEVVRTLFFGFLPLLLIAFHSPLLSFALLPVIVARFILSAYFNRLIGGYTGDCLGATQQISEIVFYLSLIVLWRFI